jgi:hypothetical protein
MPEGSTVAGEIAEATEATESATQEAVEQPRPSARQQVRQALQSAGVTAPVESETEQADPWAEWEWDGKVDSLPPQLAKIVKDARAGEAKARTGAKETAAAEARTAAEQEMAQKIGKILGLVQDEEQANPADLMAQLEQHQNAAWRAGVELGVTRVASRLGADVDSLLDSRAFIDTLDDLVDSDPNSAEFKAALEQRITEAVEKSPTKYKLASTGQEPTAQTTAPASRRPVESLRPGAAPGDSAGKADDPNEWLRQRLRNR